MLYIKILYYSNIDIIMTCNIKYEDIIFSIYKKSRLGNNEYNVFIGKVDDNIKNILKKLENRSSIVKTEVLLLKTTYPQYYMEWINIVKQKVKIRFIEMKINIDDSISEIKKKIFVYLSKTENKNYIIPENQELWLKKQNGDNELIGYYYKNKLTDTKELYQPSIFEKISTMSEISKLYFDETNLIKNTSENNTVIYDILNEGNYIKNIIYLCDAKEDETYFKLKKIPINEKLLNSYFKKYWLYVNLNYDINDVKNTLSILKDYFEKEQYVMNLLDGIKINSNIFGSCNVQTIYFKVASDEKLSNEEFDGKTEVDLFQIVDYLKDNELNDKLPFIKYLDDSFDTPFILISKEAILQNILDKNTLSEWLNLDVKSDLKKVNGISIKRYCKIFDNQPRYYSLLLNKYGVLQITISFLNSNKATFEDVTDTMNDCKILINNINKHRLVKKIDEKSKLELPEFKYNDGIITTNISTKITYMNIIIPLNLTVPLDFKSLYEFTKKFPFFIVDVPKNILKKKKENNKNKENNQHKITFKDQMKNINKNKENSIKIRYKRISGFVNMNDILLDIDKLKEKRLDNGLIIKLLQKKYEKSSEEIKSYIIEWEKKYSLSKSKISSEFKQGILITITDNKILIHGITKVYQLPLIYKFMTSFMTIFINYDNYLKTSRNFKKIFASNTLNNRNTNSVLENKYEYKNNVKLNMGHGNYTNYDIDEYYDMNNQLLMDEEKNYENELLENELRELNEPIIKPVGMASLNDVGTDIVLKCDDAIPEKATCEDFCNDEYYFIRRLQLYDIKLFKPNKDVKGKYEKFTKSCQAKRQPVVLAFDPEKDPRIKRNSFTYSMKYSSDPNTFNRWYICPKIWCPYCEIPISEDDIDKSTLKIRATKEKARMCKTVLCPFGDHLAFVKDKESENEIYPGFISKNIHPQGLCLPCCFKKQKNKPKSADFYRMQKCLGEDVNENSISSKDGQIYILGKGIPIEINRYGKLNLELERLLNTNLDTGYLGNRSGYLRKGILHHKNNSFLSAISDIIACDKMNINITVEKIKNMLIDKLDEKLFKSIYSGNLPNVFFNLQNFKNYLSNENITIDHKYIWDFLQRDKIITDEGINIFIFENNNLLCPKGENIEFFYDKNKKSVLLYKSNQYYEPIYYLEGSGKSAKMTCFFDNSREEIQKMFEISMQGCKNYNNIDWIEVLKYNIDKYQIKTDNLNISNGQELQFICNELINAINDNKLNKQFTPILQYVDSYNKVFGIKLSNGLYVPVNSTKINIKMEFKTVLDMNDIEKLSVKDTINLTDTMMKNTNIKSKINFKILDFNTKQKIVALLTEYNRFIPVIVQNDNIKDLKNANINYFSDLDYAISQNIEHTDNRIEIINKKNYEDETYMRLKFELSKYLQIKDNKPILNQILDIINTNTKDITKSRNKMYIILNKIFVNLIHMSNKDINYYDYKTPNKRVPCQIRGIKKNTKNKNNDMILNCEDDPHCISVRGQCKLYVNEINLINKDRQINNYEFYLSKIVDELIRYRLKRNEILNDNIAVIIDKHVIPPSNKYIVINTNNLIQINNIVEKLYLNNNGIIVNTKNLYETVTTNEIGFKPDRFLKIRVKELEETKSNDLSTFWLKYLGYAFTIKLNTNISLLMLMLDVINILERKNIHKNNKHGKHNRNNNNDNLFDLMDIKEMIIKYINEKKNKSTLLNAYTKQYELKNISNIDTLKEIIMSDDYNGSENDLNIISEKFNINIIILDKRIKKDKPSMNIIKTKNYKTDLVVLLYRTNIVNTYVYNLIQSKGKIIFNFNQLPIKFNVLLDNYNKQVKNNNNR